MAIELRVPAVGESIQEVQIGRWLKQQGEAVQEDENVVELETDKASMELPAPTTGVLAQILKKEGEAVSVGDVIATFESAGAKSESSSTQKPVENVQATEDTGANPVLKKPVEGNGSETGQAASKEAKSDSGEKARPKADRPREEKSTAMPVTPSGRRALREHGLKAEQIKPRGERISAMDVERYVEQQKKQESAAASKQPEPPKPAAPARAATPTHASDDIGELEQVVPMSLIRKRIAKRLVEAQQTAALLTTFNEIDMSGVMQLREKYRQRFQERYNVKLGFMSFFVKATVDALKQVPGINAEIREGNKIAYRNYYHIGVAIGAAQGLVVPVLRFAERMSFAEIELAIADFAQRAQQKQLKPEELEGGTFTISNGGVYGSLLSTPIVNPPQSGVLGMHSIQERPVARDGQVVIRPMMYVALTYDHRIVDGSEAVTFLKRIKDAVEEPSRMLLEV